MRCHGIVPQRLVHEDFVVPARYAEDEADGAKALAADVQYTLLDMFQLRSEKLGAPMPVPRW